MRLLSFLIFFIFSCPAFADEGRIIVLNSLNNDHRFIYGEINEYVEKKYLRAFESLEFNVSFVHQATQFDLYTILKKETNAYVFWIGHGARGRKLAEGVTLNPVLTDSKGSDVTDILSKVGSGIRGIFLVSCESESLEDLIRKQGVYVKSFSSKVALGKGIDKAIFDSYKLLGIKERCRYTGRRGKRHVRNKKCMPYFINGGIDTGLSYNESNEVSQKEDVEAVRIIVNARKTGTHSFQVSFNDKFLTVIPRLKKGDFYERIILVPKKIHKRRNNEFILKSGQTGSSAEKLYLGDVEFKWEDHRVDLFKVGSRTNFNGSMIYSVDNN